MPCQIPLPDGSTHEAPYQAICRLDEFGGMVKLFTIATERYEIHQYDRWLIEELAGIVGSSSRDVGFGSAGLLDGGARAWVQIRPPEGVTVGGDNLLPYVLAVSSHDRSMSTTYQLCVQRAVCDNTLEAALLEDRSVYRVRHTTGATMKLGEARDALEVAFEAADDFMVEVERLMNTPMTQRQFWATLDGIDPRPEEKVIEGRVTNARQIGSWERRREEKAALWNVDHRVAPWAGSLWGGLVAQNTWDQWALAERRSNRRDLADAKLDQFDKVSLGRIGVKDSRFLKAASGVLSGA